MDQDGTWKVIVAFGGALVAAGVAALALAEYYAAVLVIGGCVVALLGLALHWTERARWTKRPRLSRGFRCGHYPPRYFPQVPGHPHAQEVAITVMRSLYPPDVRVFCNAPILHIDGYAHEISATPPAERGFTRHHTTVNAVSVLFGPLEPLKAPATIHLTVFSDRPIRVLRVKRLKTKY